MLFLSWFIAHLSSQQQQKSSKLHYPEFKTCFCSAGIDLPGTRCSIGRIHVAGILSLKNACTQCFDLNFNLTFLSCFPEHRPRLPEGYTKYIYMWLYARYFQQDVSFSYSIIKSRTFLKLKM